MAILTSGDVLDGLWFGEGSTFSVGHRVGVQVNGNGEEVRVPKWTNCQRSYTAVRRSVETSDLRDLMVFMMSRRGGSDSFLFADKMDFSTDSTGVGTALYTDSVLGIGDGSTTTFQLRKYYGKQTRFEVVRNLLDIDTDTVAVGVSGTEKTATTHYTVTAAGVITFTVGNVPAKGELVTGGCQFYVRGFFDFNVNDFMQAAINNPNTGSIRLRILEDKSSTPTLERAYTGSDGTRYNNTSASGYELLMPHNGRFQNFAPSGSMDLRLPDIRGSGASPAVLGLENNVHSESGFYFYVKNNGSATITLKETFGTSWRTILSTPSTIPAGLSRRIYITRSVWSAS